MGMGRTIHLQIPPRNDHLALVRRVVSTAAAAGDELPDRRIDDLSLAVSEACANAIDAQRAIDADAPVAIRIDLEDGVVVVTVTDHAGGFSPDEVDPLPVGGGPRPAAARARARPPPDPQPVGVGHLRAHARRHLRADRGAPRARADPDPRQGLRPRRSG